LKNKVCEGLSPNISPAQQLYLPNFRIMFCLKRIHFSAIFGKLFIDKFLGKYYKGKAVFPKKSLAPCGFGDILGNVLGSVEKIMAVKFSKTSETPCPYCVFCA
jgi:hypothetical protein